MGKGYHLVALVAAGSPLHSAPLQRSRLSPRQHADGKLMFFGATARTWSLLANASTTTPTTTTTTPTTTPTPTVRGCPRAARTDATAPPTDWLAELPPELHLHILEGVDDFSDCAAFSLASPRLGLLALRSGLARFKDPLFAVAMRLLLIQRFAGGFGVVTLSEDTLRRYAADRRASADNFPWLARASPALCLSSEVEGAGERRIEVWRLRRDESGAKLRSRFLQSGQVKHFEGERGAERKVRMEFSDGEVRYYEGMKGAERVVRAVRADGAVQHFEGERGAERMVRVEFLSGIVLHYEGEQGVERKVRAESANGDVQYFEGGRGAERCVREKYPDGTVQYFEGESGGPHGLVQRWLSRPGVREKVLAAIAEKGLDAAIALAASVALDGEDWV